jgi:flagellar hook assembly protein FlgD
MSVSSSGRMTAVDFSLDAMAAEDVSVAVFDVSGRRIADIAHGSYAPGEHRVEWDGRMRDGSSARNGVYFVRAWTRDQSSDMRVTVLR